MKYWPGVPTLAPHGLRTHICQAPRKQAPRNAANATQKWARQSRSTFRTGNPPVLVRLELALREDLDSRPHPAVAQAAILVARHQEIAGARELSVNLGDKARHHH